jgi:hypothetical protein
LARKAIEACPHGTDEPSPGEDEIGRVSETVTKRKAPPKKKKKDLNFLTEFLICENNCCFELKVKQEESTPLDLQVVADLLDVFAKGLRAGGIVLKPNEPQQFDIGVDLKAVH